MVGALALGAWQREVVDSGTGRGAGEGGGSIHCQAAMAWERARTETASLSCMLAGGVMRGGGLLVVLDQIMDGADLQRGVRVEGWRLGVRGR